MNRQRIILFLLIIAIFLLLVVSRQNYMFAVESSTEREYSVMRPDIKTMKIWQIEYWTAHTTTEKSAEEWLNNVKPYVEFGWWPSDAKDVGYLEMKGYRQSKIDWKTSEEIIDKLFCLTQIDDQEKEKCLSRLNNTKNNESFKNNNQLIETNQKFTFQNFIQSISEILNNIFSLFNKNNINQQIR